MPENQACVAPRITGAFCKRTCSEVQEDVKLEARESCCFTCSRIGTVVKAFVGPQHGHPCVSYTRLTISTPSGHNCLATGVSPITGVAVALCSHLLHKTVKSQNGFVVGLVLIMVMGTYSTRTL